MVRACQFCRRRKIKCDTAKPTYSACRTGNRPCIYDGCKGSRRPSAALVNSLRSEKANLQELLGRLKSGNEDQRRALLDELSLPDAPSPTSIYTKDHAEQSVLGCTPNDGTKGGSGQPVASSYENVAGEGSMPREANDTQIMPHAGNDYSSHEQANEDEDNPHEEEAAERDASPDDTIFSSTAIHSTSPIHPAKTCYTSYDKQEKEDVPLLSDYLVCQAAIGRQQEHRLRFMETIRGVPAELALHLLDLHWSRQHHTFLLTYRPTFMRELVDGGSYCSDLLLNAVFACSAKFSERLELRSDPSDPETAGSHFFANCEDLLLRGGQLSVSRIPTVIALLMLGSTFVGRGRTSKGWLYTGAALRMVYDLGLHINPQKIYRSNAEQVEIRRRVFWGAFICEKLQSLYLARPPTIGLRDAHVSLDLMDTFEELEPWEPYQDPKAAEAGTVVGKSVGTPMCTYSVSVFQQLCRLSRIMTQIMNKIYFVGATADETLRDVTPLEEELTGWYNDLPNHLIFEPWTKGPTDSATAMAPNGIILLTTYHSLVILLHRPFTSSHKSSGSRGSESHDPSSWRKCTTAARNITSLALSYRSIYPLRRSNYLLSYAVYVACTIHVLNAASLGANGENNGYAESSLSLSTSLRCLDELAVPNSGLADTARIIRRLMAARGVAESPGMYNLKKKKVSTRQRVSSAAYADIGDEAPAEFQTPAYPDVSDNIWQAVNSSPVYSDLSHLPFQDFTLQGQDLLFGFMDENISSAAFGEDGFSVL